MALHARQVARTSAAALRAAQAQQDGEDALRQEIIGRFTEAATDAEEQRVDEDSSS